MECAGCVQTGGGPAVEPTHARFGPTALTMRRRQVFFRTCLSGNRMAPWFSHGGSWTEVLERRDCLTPVSFCGVVQSQVTSCGEEGVGGPGMADPCPMPGTLLGDGRGRLTQASPKPDVASRRVSQMESEAGGGAVTPGRHGVRGSTGVLKFVLLAMGFPWLQAAP